MSPAADVAEPHGRAVSSPRRSQGACRTARALGACLLAALLAGAVGLAPRDAGAIAELRHRLRVTAEAGRVSVVAEDAPVTEILEALAQRTGVELAAVNGEPLRATLAVEGESLEVVLARVVRAATPATNAASVLTYDRDQKLLAVTIVFRGGAGGVTAPDAETNATGDRLRDEGGTILERLRQAGVRDEDLDLTALEHLVAAGVAGSEILELLADRAFRVEAVTSAEPAETGTAAVVEPLSDTERQILGAKLRAAGIATPSFDDAQLLAARQLESDGVPLAEIVELLSETATTAGGDTGPVRDDPSTLIIAPPVTGAAARALRDELRRAGVPDSHLDEDGIIVAGQLRAAGVSLDEIRENLAAMRATPGR
jgi:hypothetical protein